MQEWNDTERWDGFIIRFKLLPFIIIVITLTILLIMLAVQEDKKDKFNRKRFILYVTGAIAGGITVIAYCISFLFIPYAGL